MLTAVKQLVPVAIKQNKFRVNYRNKREARRLATRNKRLDQCAVQWAHWLNVSGATLRGKICLEVGCGWLLTHALCCYLLGAKRVICTDIERLIYPQYLTIAINKATAYIIRDCLSPYKPHHKLRKRLLRLQGQKRWDLDTLSTFGIEYMAPVDLAKQPLDEQVNFIYSTSCLEHVPVNDVVPLLGNLRKMLAPDGVMFHAIHLEDHADIDGDPLRFLGEVHYEAHDESARGNRLRASSWMKLFDKAGFEASLVYQWHRLDKPLPDRVVKTVMHEGDYDLRVSHIGVFCRGKDAVFDSGFC